MNACAFHCDHELNVVLRCAVCTACFKLTVIACWTQAILEAENVRYAGHSSLGLYTVQTETFTYTAGSHTSWAGP